MSRTGPRHTMFWARFTSNVEDRGPRYSFPWLDSMFELSSKCFYDFHDFHDFSWIVMMCHFSWLVILPSSSLFFSLLLSSSNFFQLLPTSSNFYLLLLSSFLFQEEGPRSRVSCSVSAFPRSTRSVVWQNYSCSWRTTSTTFVVVQSMSGFNFHWAAPPVGPCPSGPARPLGRKEHSMLGESTLHPNFRVVFRCTAGYSWLQLATAGYSWLQLANVLVC